MTQESECIGKVRFLNRQAAKDAIKHMVGRKGKLRSYPCSWCPFFHIGHFHPGARAAANYRRRTATT